jgi:hypothetical protein
MQFTSQLLTQMENVINGHLMAFATIQAGKERVCIIVVRW